MWLHLYKWIRKHLLNIDDRSQLEIAISNGLKIGNDCSVMGGVIMDPGHCWLIEIGDRVTLAPNVHVLAHDASTKRRLGYTMIGRVVIGDDCFIGAGAIILPGVVIGNNCIIGSGAVVRHSIPENSVVIGNPAKVVKDAGEFFKDKSKMLSAGPCYDDSYTIGKISVENMERMRQELHDRIGFVR